MTTWISLLIIGVGLAAFIIIWGEVERREFNRMIVTSIEDGIEQVGRELMPTDDALAQVAPPHADLHAKYAALAEIDPNLAGRLKYAEQLARHGA